MTVRNTPIAPAPLGHVGADADTRSVICGSRPGRLYELLAEVDIDKATVRLAALGGHPRLRIMQGWRAIHEARKQRSSDIYARDGRGPRVRFMAALNGGVIRAGVRVK